MKNFTAFCLLALGASAVKLELQSQAGASDSFDDALTQMRSDGVEFVCSIADAIEEAHNDNDDRSDDDDRAQPLCRAAFCRAESDDSAQSSSSGDESDDEGDFRQSVGLADPFGNETDI